MRWTGIGASGMFPSYAGQGEPVTLATCALAVDTGRSDDGPGSAGRHANPKPATTAWTGIMRDARPDVRSVRLGSLRVTRMGALLLGAFLLGFGRTPVAAQDTIADAMDCASCELELGSVVRVGEAEGPGALPGSPRIVHADGRGRIWVVYGDTPPMVFDAQGQFIQRVGRMGGGPNEFEGPRAMTAMGDSVAIYDRSGRLVVVGPDLDPVRSLRAAEVRISELLALDWPRLVLINGIGRGPDRVGWPLHLADADAAELVVRESFGGGDGALLPGRSGAELMRFLAPAAGGGAWVLKRTERYEFARWTEGGQRLERHLRMSEMFPEGFHGMAGGPQHAPSPALVDIHQAPDSLLWVVGRVPRAREAWRQAWRDVGIEEIPQEPTTIPVRAFPRVYDLTRSVLEVVDPARSRVLWRGHPDSYVMGLLPGPRIAAYVETDMGIPYIEISQVSLRRPGG